MKPLAQSSITTPTAPCLWTFKATRLRQKRAPTGRFLCHLWTVWGPFSLRKESWYSKEGAMAKVRSCKSKARKEPNAEPWNTGWIQDPISFICHDRRADPGEAMVQGQNTTSVSCKYWGVSVDFIIVFECQDLKEVGRSVLCTFVLFHPLPLRSVLVAKHLFWFWMECSPGFCAVYCDMQAS